MILKEVFAYSTDQHGLYVLRDLALVLTPVRFFNVMTHAFFKGIIIS
jgi:NADH:ubiquinone oxidoreductase subunit 5 (subunit L)/multisubunit Na+/H+ antiporter MnhA subunit